MPTHKQVLFTISDDILTFVNTVTDASADVIILSSGNDTITFKVTSVIQAYVYMLQFIYYQDIHGVQVTYRYEGICMTERDLTQPMSNLLELLFDTVQHQFITSKYLPFVKIENVYYRITDYSEDLFHALTMLSLVKYLDEGNYALTLHYCNIVGETYVNTLDILPLVLANGTSSVNEPVKTSPPPESAVDYLRELIPIIKLELTEVLIEASDKMMRRMRQSSIDRTEHTLRVIRNDLHNINEVTNDLTRQMSKTLDCIHTLLIQFTLSQLRPKP